MQNLLTIFLQIDWSDLQYTVDDFGKTVYSFPVHIRVLLAVTLIFLLIILVLLGVVLGSRIYKTGHVIKRDFLHRKYQKVFRELLFEDRTNTADIKKLFDPKDLRKPFHRETIMEEIIHLHENFTGETAERLEEIYVQLNFHRDSMKKLKDRKWYTIAKGMRELALMNVKEALPQVSVFLKSKNEILRMESRVAIIRLSEKDPLAFLSHETGPLTDWDTANIHAMLSKMPDNMTPHFSRWLDSPNKDVVIFCIYMIGANRQQDAVEPLLKLLKSDDERIRIASIKALRSLNAVAAEQPLVEMYERENNYVRTEILRTLEAVGSGRSVALLEKIIRQPLEDHPLVIQAIRALLSVGTQGVAIVDRIFREADENMQLVISHARDKRL